MLYAVRCVGVGDRGVSPVLITPETLTFKADQAMSGQDSSARRTTALHSMGLPRWCPHRVENVLSCMVWW